MNTNDQHPEQDVIRTVEWQARATVARLVLAVHERDEQAFNAALRFTFSGALPNLAPAIVLELASEAANLQRLLLGQQDATETTSLALHELDLTYDPEAPGENGTHEADPE